MNEAMEQSPWTDRITACIEAERQRRSVDHALLAFSGGPDSTFLLHHFLFVAAKLDFGFTAVHVDHGLRGREGTRDRKHCEKITDAHDVDLVVQQLEAPKGASEGWARRARYEALLEVAQAERAQIVVTAHHLDDDVETILLKLTRGVRPSRMYGMRASRRLAPGSDVRLVRPLLGIERREIEAWIEEHDVAVVRDSSNDDPKVPRNRLRHEVIPVLDAIAPPGWKRRFVATFSETAKQVRSRERAAELAMLVALLRGAGLEPTDARLEKLREGLVHGDAHKLLGTRFGFEIERRGNRIEVVTPDARPARREARREEAPPPSQPALGRPRPSRDQRARDARPTPTERASRGRTAPPEEPAPPRTPPVPPPDPKPVAPPEPPRVLEPGVALATPIGSVSFQTVTAAAATKRIQALRRKRNPAIAVLQYPELAKDRVEVAIRPVHEHDRIQTLGFPHVRRIKRAMQSRGIGQERRDRSQVVLVNGQPAWVVGFEIAHEARFRTDEDAGKGTFLLLEFDESQTA